jgi:acylphosphatase
MKAFHITLEGKVQGVGFRYFVRQKALELGLTGWVRNKTDGSVEVETEGTEAMLSFFIDLLKTGNSRSRIDRVSVTELPELPHYSSFFIKY